MKTGVRAGKEMGRYLDGKVQIAIEPGVPWPPFGTDLRVVVEWSSDYDDHPEVQAILADLAKAQGELDVAVYGDRPFLVHAEFVAAAQTCRSLQNDYFRTVARLFEEGQKLFAGGV